jgi:hypothetical protein
VHIIGAAVWPKPGMVPTATFVKEKGAAMSYAIAEDIAGSTARSFMTAAGQNGIPCVMVVNGEGKLAWIGNPLAGGLNEAIAALVPTFDLANFEKHAAEREKLAQELQAKVKAHMDGAREAELAKDWQKVSDNYDALLLLDAKEYVELGVYSYQALLKLDDAAPAKAYGERLVGGAYKDLANPLNMLAWSIVDPDVELADEKRDLALASTAATRADELKEHKDPSILDTLARVQFLSGDVTTAIETQRKAVELAGKPDLKADLQGRLEEYLKAGG